MTREQILNTVREMFADQPRGRTNDDDIIEYLDGAIGELVSETHRTLADKVIARIDGLPDHPWIPGVMFNDGELMKTLRERI